MHARRASGVRFRPAGLDWIEPGYGFVSCPSLLLVVAGEEADDERNGVIAADLQFC